MEPVLLQILTQANTAGLDQAATASERLATTLADNAAKAAAGAGGVAAAEARYAALGLEFDHVTASSERAAAMVGNLWKNISAAPTIDQATARLAELRAELAATQEQFRTTLANRGAPVISDFDKAPGAIGTVLTAQERALQSKISELEYKLVVNLDERSAIEAVADAKTFVQGFTKEQISASNVARSALENALVERGALDVSGVLAKETTALAKYAAAVRLSRQASEEFANLPALKAAGEMGAPESRALQESFVGALKTASTAASQLSTTVIGPLAEKIAQVEAQMSAVAGKPVKVNLELGIPKTEEAVTRIRQAADAMELEVPVEVDKAQATADFAELQRLAVNAFGKPVLLETDTADATAKVQAFQVEAAKVADIQAQFNVDVSMAMLSLEDVQARFTELKTQEALNLDTDFSAAKAELAKFDAAIKELKDDIAFLEVNIDVDPAAAGKIATLQKALATLETERFSLDFDTRLAKASAIEVKTEIVELKRFAAQRFNVNLDTKPALSAMDAARTKATSMWDAFVGKGEAGSQAASKIKPFTNALGEVRGMLTAGGGGVVGALEAGAGAFARVTSVAGPVAGAVVAAGIALAVLGPSAIDAASKLEDVTVQFTVLLGSLAAAKDRVAEYKAASDLTPFGVEAVTNAGRVLEGFGGKLISTGASLAMVSDIAVATGRPMESLADDFGRLYGALKTGQGLGEVQESLQRLGVLGPTARVELNKISTEVQNGSINMQTAWARTQQVFSKYAGASALALDTLSGKQAEQERIQKKMMQGLGDALMPAAKGGMDLLTGGFKAMAGAISFVSPLIKVLATGLGVVFSVLGEGLAIIGNVFGALGRGLEGAITLMAVFVKGVSELPVISQVLGAVGTAFDLLGKGIDVVGGVVDDLAADFERGLRAAEDFLLGAEAGVNRAKKLEEEIAGNILIVTDAYIKAIKDRKSASDAAWKGIVDSQQDGLDKGLRLAELYGQLTSQALTDAIERGTPDQKRAASEARDAISAEIRLLTTDTALIDGLTATFTRAGATVNDEFLGNLLRADTPEKLAAFATENGVALTDPFIQQLLAMAPTAKEAALAVLAPDVAQAAVQRIANTYAQVKIANENGLLDAMAATQALVKGQIDRFGTPAAKQLADAIFVGSEGFADAFSGKFGETTRTLAQQALKDVQAAQRANPIDLTGALSADKAVTAKAAKDQIVSYYTAARAAGVSNQAIMAGAAALFKPKDLREAEADLKRAGRDSVMSYFSELESQGLRGTAITRKIAEMFPDEIKDNLAAVKRAAADQMFAYIEEVSGRGKSLMTLFKGLAKLFPEQLEDPSLKRRIANATTDAFGAIAENIEGQRSAITTAIENIQSHMKNLMSPKKERKVLTTELSKIDIGKILKSGDQGAINDTLYGIGLIGERLEAIGGDTEKLTGKAKVAWEAYQKYVTDAAATVTANEAALTPTVPTNIAAIIGGATAPVPQKIDPKLAGKAYLEYDDIVKRGVSGPDVITAATSAGTVVTQAVSSGVTAGTAQVVTAMTTFINAGVQAIRSPAMQAVYVAAGATVAAMVVGGLNSNIGVAAMWGAALGAAWAGGIGAGALSRLTDPGGAFQQALEYAAANMAGQSPPKMGPLHTIDKGGYAVGRSWSEGMAAALLPSIDAALGGVAAKLNEPLGGTPVGIMSTSSMGIGGDSSIQLLGVIAKQLGVSNQQRSQGNAKLDLQSRLLAQGVAVDPRGSGPLPARGLVAQLALQSTGG